MKIKEDYYRILKRAPIIRTDTGFEWFKSDLSGNKLEDLDDKFTWPLIKTTGLDFYTLIKDGFAYNLFQINEKGLQAIKIYEELTK